MELSYLSFFDQFRKIYVGDQAQKTSKVCYRTAGDCRDFYRITNLLQLLNFFQAYRIVSERLGLHDESMVLSVFVNKM